MKNLFVQTSIDIPFSDGGTLLLDSAIRSRINARSSNMLLRFGILSLKNELYDYIEPISKKEKKTEKKINIPGMSVKRVS